MTLSLNQVTEGGELVATKYAEIIFEDGSHSIMSFDEEDELRSFLTENHRRVTNGEPTAPQEMYARSDLDPNDFGGRVPSVEQLKSRPGFRAKRVLIYDKHPSDLVPVGNDGTMPVKVAAVQQLVEGMAGAGEEVNMHQLVQALRDEASPVFTTKPGKYESQFKMDEAGEYDLSFLTDSGSSGPSTTGGGTGA